jgi:hypothetical protein
MICPLSGPYADDAVATSASFVAAAADVTSSGKCTASRTNATPMSVSPHSGPDALAS